MRAGVVLVSAIAACGGLGVLAGCEKDEPERPPPSVVGTTPAPPPTSSGGPAPSSGCGFPAEPTSFSLPAIPGLPFGSFTKITGTATCNNSRPFIYELRDMTGDQQPDLFVKSACDDTTIGSLAWRVYVNTGSGFAAEPTRFPLPVPRLADCATTTLLDIDGDLKPDLVTTSLCTDASVGTTRWLVNRNNGAGFDAITSYALPEGMPQLAFAALSAAEPECPVGRPAFQAMDIDGDRKLDLVVTKVCNDTAVGTSQWRVYRGDGAAFTTATPFALPTTPPATPFMYASATATKAACDSSAFSRSYQLVDLDGDFAPEMLVTTLCNDVNVGTTKWLVHKNTGTGFAAPTTIDLPIFPGVRGAFTELTGAPACDASKPGFETLDVTGDFHRDLLLTRSCVDAASGVTRWLLYPHGNDKNVISLAREAVPFALPAALGATPSAPIGLDAERACTGTRRPAFTSQYLVSRKLDLVVTQACQDTSVGATQWLVYEAGCR